MKTTLVVVVLVNIIVINAAPVRETCAELLANIASARVYAYCNKTTNTLQESHLEHLYRVSDKVIDVLHETYNERVSSYMYHATKCKCMCNVTL